MDIKVKLRGEYYDCTGFDGYSLISEYPLQYGDRHYYDVQGSACDLTICFPRDNKQGTCEQTENLSLPLIEHYRRLSDIAWINFL